MVLALIPIVGWALALVAPTVIGLLFMPNPLATPLGIALYLAVLF